MPFYNARAKVSWLGGIHISFKTFKNQQRGTLTRSLSVQTICLLDGNKPFVVPFSQTKLWLMKRER